MDLIGFLLLKKFELHYLWSFSKNVIKLRIKLIINLKYPYKRHKDILIVTRFSINRQISIQTWPYSPQRQNALWKIHQLLITNIKEKAIRNNIVHISLILITKIIKHWSKILTPISPKTWQQTLPIIKKDLANDDLKIHKIEKIRYCIKNN